MQSTRSLVRAVEVWVPRGEVLVPSSGLKVRPLEDAPIEGDAAPRLALGIPMGDGESTRRVACLIF
jgi:hypothetical protein